MWPTFRVPSSDELFNVKHVCLEEQIWSNCLPSTHLYLLIFGFWFLKQVISVLCLRGWFCIHARLRVSVSFTPFANGVFNCFPICRWHVEPQLGFRHFLIFVFSYQTKPLIHLSKLPRDRFWIFLHSYSCYSQPMSVVSLSHHFKFNQVFHRAVPVEPPTLSRRNGVGRVLVTFPVSEEGLLTSP